MSTAMLRDGDDTLASGGEEDLRDEETFAWLLSVLGSHSLRLRDEGAPDEMNLPWRLLPADEDHLRDEEPKPIVSAEQTFAWLLSLLLDEEPFASDNQTFASLFLLLGEELLRD